MQPEPESPSSQATESEQARYETPRLKVRGSLADLTRAVGPNLKPDGGSGSTRRSHA